MNKEKIFESVVSVLIWVVFVVGVLFCGTVAFRMIRPDTMAVTINAKPLNLPKKYHTFVCADDTMRTNVVVYIVETLNKEGDGGMPVGGAFYAHEMAIVLVDTDINTVAHEVSHLVDWVVQEKGIHDDETRAYLQGYFTECVYQNSFGKPLKISKNEV